MSEHLTENRDKRRAMMLEEPVIRVLPLIAIPMMISMLIDSFYNIADAYFVSQLGSTATAAVGVNDSLAQIIRSISMGFGVGASSYISRLMGARQDEEACRVGTTTLITAMLVLFVLAAPMQLLVDPLVVLLGSVESTNQYSVDYARFILAAAPFTAGEVVLAQLLRAEGSTYYSMVGMVSGCVVNVVLDPIFITGLGLEVAGAALATGISKFVSFSVLLIPFLRGKTLIELKLCFFTPNRKIYSEVAKMGVPAFLRSSMLGVSTIVTNNIAGFFGDCALAAASVSQRCVRLVSAAILGFGQGFQPLAGYCWGAKQYKRVREAFWTCSGLGVLAVLVIGSIMFAFAPALVNLFAKGDLDVIGLGSTMIRSQCITMPLHIWVVIVNGLFLALGRAKAASFLGLSRQLICYVPCLIVFALLCGETGLAIAQAAADVLSVMVTTPLVAKLMREIKKAESADSTASMHRIPNSIYKNL